MLQNISNTFYSSKKNIYCGFNKKNVKQQHRAQTFSALVIIIRKNVPCAPNQHIRMSFEGSCDTKTISDGKQLFSTVFSSCFSIFCGAKLDKIFNKTFNKVALI